MQTVGAHQDDVTCIERHLDPIDPVDAIAFGSPEVDRDGVLTRQRARLGLGYLSQEPSIFRHMSVRANLLAVLEALGMLDLSQLTL